MLVVSVALLDETEIQHHQKTSKDLHGSHSHRANSEGLPGSQNLDHSLFKALDLQLAPEIPRISEYFPTHTSDTKSSSNSDVVESHKKKAKML
ncbi:unnamed protein product, partial [Meganyctiphanes norvegica]